MLNGSVGLLGVVVVRLAVVDELGLVVVLVAVVDESAVERVEEVVVSVVVVVVQSVVVDLSMVDLPFWGLKIVPVAVFEVLVECSSIDRSSMVDLHFGGPEVER